MNIVNMLKKQKEAGKNIVMSTGAVVSEDSIKKEATKNYLAGLKSGEISTSVSLDEYMKENAANCVTVDEVIEIIEQGIDYGELIEN